MTPCPRQRLRIKAEIFKATGQPTRLAIVELLRERGIRIGESAQSLGADTTSIPRHLSLLRSLGIVIARIEVLKTFCTLTAGLAGPFMACLDERISHTLEKMKA